MLDVDEIYAKREYCLRVYMNAIREAKKKTKEEWLNEWIHCGKGPFVLQEDWISYLKHCAWKELDRLDYIKKAA